MSRKLSITLYKTMSREVVIDLDIVNILLVSDRLYAIWQVPNVETVCGLNYHCQTSIKQHDWSDVASIAQLIAIYHIREWMLREGKPGV